MKYINKFESNKQNNIKLTPEVISFGEHLYNFIKDVIDSDSDSDSDTYDVKSSIDNNCYKLIDRDENIEVLTITINNKDTFAFGVIRLNIIKYFNNDTYIKYSFLNMMTENNQIIPKINEFLKSKFNNHYKLKIGNDYHLYISDLDYLKNEINKDNFETFLNMNKYNL